MRLLNGKFVRGIRVAKIVALAMVAAPEPISTALGLVVLGVLTPPELILKYREAQKKKRLRHILKGYLHTYRPFGYGMSYSPKTSSSLPYRSPKPLFGVSQAQNSPNPREQRNLVPLKEKSPVIYHTLDQRIVARCYNETGGTKAGFVGYWGRQQKLDITKPTAHSPRLNSPSLS